MKALVVFLGCDIFFYKFFILDIPANEDLSFFQVGEEKNPRKEIRLALDCVKEFIL